MGQRAFLGVLGKWFWNFNPRNFISGFCPYKGYLGGRLLDSGDSLKVQGTVAVSAQISTKAIRLMVRVRGGVFEVFWGRFTAIYSVELSHLK